jgi:hypothetical protein
MLHTRTRQATPALVPLDGSVAGHRVADVAWHISVVRLIGLYKKLLGFARPCQYFVAVG